MTLNNKKFEALRAKWYKKLEDQGFKDIEDFRGFIKRPASSNFITFYDPIKMETKQEYYRLAGQFLHDYKFVNPIDKMIWEHHSNGMSIRNIIKELKHKNISAYRDKVHEAIKRLSKIMLIRANGNK